MSSWQIINKYRIPTRETYKDRSFFHSGQLALPNEAFTKAVDKAIADLSHYFGEEISLREALAKLPDLPQAIRVAVLQEFENLEGASADELSVYGLAFLENATVSEEHNFFIDGPLTQLCSVLTPKLNMRLNQIVRTIQWAKDHVTAHTERGDIFEAQKLIITVPLGVLRNSDITFDPPLPPEKLAAIAGIGWGAY